MVKKNLKTLNFYFPLSNEQDKIAIYLGKIDERINTQNKIFKDLKKYGMTFNVDKVPDFIDKVFCLVSIRNCVMHCNSLEILIRFYNPKLHELRKKSDRKKYINMIKSLSIEKTHE